MARGEKFFAPTQIWYPIELISSYCLKTLGVFKIFLLHYLTKEILEDCYQLTVLLNQNLCRQ